MSESRNKQRRRGFLARQSLLSRYLIIVLGAFLFIPIMLPLASVIFMTANSIGGQAEGGGMKYGSPIKLEESWHAEASALHSSEADKVDAKLRELKKKYPEAGMFWVDEDGRTKLRLLKDGSRIPDQWTTEEAIRFMKESIGGDPFTVVAFLGDANSEEAFMVLQMPRSLVQAGSPGGEGTTFFILFIFVMFALFVALSLLFFMQIRKRLLLLQSAMSQRNEHGLPAPVEQKRPDEIGGLEAAFNGMVEQLTAGRLRQQEEEDLRKRLISNLSHDLRTPLTVMRGHLYTLGKENVSDKGKESLHAMEQKTEGLGELIDNLLAYTLMTSGRYKLEPEPVDVWRLVRESAAAWYPVWEKAGIEADIRLPSEPFIWQIDKLAFRRVLDNLFQNVVRHAAEGKYVGLYAEAIEGRAALVVADRGPGMEGTPKSSEDKGAGIGLAIVDYLLREMGLAWRRESSEQGTRVYIFLNEI